MYALGDLGGVRGNLGPQAIGADVGFNFEIVLA
jgi:hypothetical protein